MMTYIRSLHQPLPVTQHHCLQLKKFTLDDAEIIYTWRNHPTVRQQALDEREFTFAEHYQWCVKKVTDPKTYIWMAYEANQCRIGVVRYDFLHSARQKIQDATFVIDEHAMISIYLDPNLIGNGYGKKILVKSMAMMQSIVAETWLVAQVKVQNVASRKLFEGCGFYVEENLC
jgi:RimJ/RimL family protein N-acetyltransferase